MTPSTKLTTVGQVAKFLNNNEDVGGRLMLAEDGKFSLIAGRNKYKGGVAFHVRNETTKRPYALTGFRPNDRSQGAWKAGDLVQRVIDKADAYIAQFLTPPTRKLTEYPYEDPTVHPAPAESPKPLSALQNLIGEYGSSMVPESLKRAQAELTALLAIASAAKYLALSLSTVEADHGQSEQEYSTSAAEALNQALENYRNIK